MVMLPTKHLHNTFVLCVIQNSICQRKKALIKVFEILLGIKVLQYVLLTFSAYSHFYWAERYLMSDINVHLIASYVCSPWCKLVCYQDIDLFYMHQMIRQTTLDVSWKCLNKSLICMMWIGAPEDQRL